MNRSRLANPYDAQHRYRPNITMVNAGLINKKRFLYPSPELGVAAKPGSFTMAANTLQRDGRTA